MWRDFQRDFVNGLCPFAHRGGGESCPDLSDLLLKICRGYLLRQLLSRVRADETCAVLVQADVALCEEDAERRIDEVKVKHSIAQALFCWKLTFL